MATSTQGEVTIIMHGWSDCSESFVTLKRFLVAQGIGKVQTVYYMDYESREDNITFNDVIDGFNDQLIEKKLIGVNGEKLCDLNVIVHSTGGLVIRHWIWRYYRDRIAECPISRLVMLAPANFGSPLAHRGKSFLGSLFKGRWKIGDFLEVGRELLNGLELASPYQWDLAHKDLLVKNPYYNRNQIQTTVLVGIEDYDGIRGWVNKPGTDGTVVIAGTSLDSAKLTLDFSDPNQPGKWMITNPKDDFAFAVLENLDHGSIIDSIDVNQAGELLLEALKRKSNTFEAFQNKLEEITKTSYQNSSKSTYQQFILHAIDDQGVSIRDYTVEFFVWKANKVSGGLIDVKKTLSDKESELSEQISRMLTAEFHTCTTDSSYRRFLIDPEEIGGFLSDAKNKFGQDVALSMKIYVPDVDKGIRYHTEKLQNIVLSQTGVQPTDSPKFFFKNTTTLIELRVDRFNDYVTVDLNPKKH